jgi:ribonucleoside-diphosphate reductase alpha chain
VRDLQERGLWNADVRGQIRASDGSIQNLDLPEDIRMLYRTAWEYPQKVLIDMAAARGAFIDQSQSLNLFMATPTIGKLSSMYRHVWASGLKTTYYLRSRPASSINKSVYAGTDAAAVACSLENPETCEACD